MKNLFLLLLITLIFFGCKKKMQEECQEDVNSSACYYENYSTNEYDFIWNELDGSSASGPFFTSDADYLYGEPVFNPNNPYQIAYMRYTWPGTISDELWTFDFCTGQAHLIAENFNANIDWGVNGWLIYTGSEGQTYKVKANGDSLTLMPSDYFVTETGKWNPSGTAFWRRGNTSTHYSNEAGEEYFVNTTISYQPFDWLNDSTVIGISQNKIYSRVIPDGELILLNTTGTSTVSNKFYNKDKNTCYVNKINVPKKLLEYSLSGDNQVDTIKNLIESYRYYKGNYGYGKILTTLIRQEWADSISDIRNLRSNVLILNEDGSNERLVEFPE